MLSNRDEEHPQANLESSMSFNMTKDLEEAGMGRQGNNRVIYEEQDRAMDDD